MPFKTILTPFFSPNIGGVETHLDDLVNGLDKGGYKVYVQTYSPITTEGVAWKSYEKRGNSIGSQIILNLKEYSINSKLKPSCGCAIENIASQKTIEKSGFVSRYKMINFKIK